jgi:hypothetical protein
VAVEEVLSKRAEVVSDVFRIVMSSNTLRNNERLSVISREHNFQHFLNRFGRDRHLRKRTHLLTGARLSALQFKIDDYFDIQTNHRYGI